MSWSFTLTSTCTQKLSSPHKDVCETTAAHELFFSATNLMFSGIVNIECPPYILRMGGMVGQFFSSSISTCNCRLNVTDGGGRDKKPLQGTRT